MTPHPTFAAAPFGVRAVLFDMDGLLVDTEDFWFEADRLIAAELGAVLTEADHQVCIGGPMERTAAHLITISGSDATIDDVAARLSARMALLIADAEIVLQPGAADLLDALEAARVPHALVTSSLREVADPILARVAAGRFAFTIAGDEVANTKPHPEPYLTAAARLGADPAACVVLEDSIPGVAAAEAAGCAVVAVPQLVSIAPRPRRAVVRSLEEVDLAFLHGLAEARAA